MAEGQGKGGGGGGKDVEPTPPRVGFLTWITRAPAFFAEVRQEGQKVTWPTWAETRVTSIAVFIMIVLAVIFFLLVDWALSAIVRFGMGLV
jgi:preprotein translocase subunit SecE